MHTNDDQEGTHRSLHRIKTARETAGISLRSMARRMRTTATELKREENSSDLRLSQLYRWQRELKVPIAELLEEPEEVLSEPIRQRACLVRVTKTVNSLLRKVQSPNSKRLARMLLNQLEELMPELREIGSWPEYGQRKSDDDLGQAAYRLLAAEELLIETGDTEGASMTD